MKSTASEPGLSVTQERENILNEKRKNGESAKYQVSRDKLAPKCPYLLLCQKKASTRRKTVDTVSLALVHFQKPLNRKTSLRRSCGYRHTEKTGKLYMPASRGGFAGLSWNRKQYFEEESTLGVNKVFYSSVQCKIF